MFLTKVYAQMNKILSIEHLRLTHVVINNYADINLKLVFKCVYLFLKLLLA